MSENVPFKILTKLCKSCNTERYLFEFKRRKNYIFPRCRHCDKLGSRKSTLEKLRKKLPDNMGWWNRPRWRKKKEDL